MLARVLLTIVNELRKFPLMTKKEIERIFDAFGGTSALARAAGVPITTAHSWLRRGRIPSWREVQLKQAALVAKISLPQQGAH